MRFFVIAPLFLVCIFQSYGKADLSSDINDIDALPFSLNFGGRTFVDYNHEGDGTYDRRDYSFTDAAGNYLSITFFADDASGYINYQSSMIDGTWDSSVVSLHGSHDVSSLPGFSDFSGSNSFDPFNPPIPPSVPHSGLPDTGADIPALISAGIVSIAAAALVAVSGLVAYLVIRSAVRFSKGAL